MRYKVSQRSLRNTKDGRVKDGSCVACGQSSLYWYHDTDGVDHAHRTCSIVSHPCYGSSPRYVICDEYGTVHTDVCRGNDEAKRQDRIKEEVSLKEEVATTTETVYGSDLSADELFDAMRRKLGTSVSKAEVQSVVDAALEDYGNRLDEKIKNASLPTVVHVKTVERGTVDVGLTHFAFPTVLTTLMAGDAVFMQGPAGTGKTTLAEQAATALGVPFGFISLTEGTMEHEIVGYCGPNGEPHSTVFADCFAHEGAFADGGLFLFDECDHGHANTLGKVNAALANSCMAFPWGMKKKGARFYCMAGANTFGTGPSRLFQGANKLDFAFLDRFSVIEIPVDEAIESSVAMSYDVPADQRDRLIVFVRELRRKVVEHKLPLDFTPRAIIQGCALLAAGLPMAQVIAQRVRKGISDADWARLTDGVRIPA